ncbi:MAG: sigma-70 family RNA polymerase sigma factor [Pseudomonadales bacterium]|nr:sigma-70 family RNA polymerase sigma factor [Pseudomonadales bacterium]
METKAQDAKYWNQCIEKVGTSRDKAAFSELFAHFSPALKAFLVKSGGVTPEIAEELVQDAMIKVWRKAPTFSANQASASTWIYTIARNTRIDWLRKQANQDPNALTAEDMYDDRDEPTPYSSLVQLHDKRRIKEHMGALPSEQAEVLQMMYFQGKSGQQVADILQVPLGTVKSRIRLAMEKLKIALAPAFQDGLSEGNNV